MSRYLRIPNGNYKIEVQPGGQITFDTGEEVGRVVITGDLIVEGNTTTVESETMVVKDNIIELNDGETGAGITLGTAGIQIDRGTENKTKFVYDESIVNPLGSSGGSQGFWSLTDTAGAFLGLQTNQIVTGGTDLYLINEGLGKVTVTGTDNYELNLDDDDLTNKKYVDDAITLAFATVFLTQIGDGVIDPSTVKVLDNESTGLDSKIEISVDNKVVTEFYGGRVEFETIRIQDNMIETMDSDVDLILSAPGTGSVLVDDALHLGAVPGIDESFLDIPPSTPVDGLKLYATNTSGVGGTSLFFVNSEDTRDEIISNNRSLVYSMIF
jgi:hypothetical protein